MTDNRDGGGGGVFASGVVRAVFHAISAWQFEEELKFQDVRINVQFLNGSFSLYAVQLELFTQGIQGDSQLSGGMGEIAAGLLDNTADVVFFHLGQ